MYKSSLQAIAVALSIMFLVSIVLPEAMLVLLFLNLSLLIFNQLNKWKQFSGKTTFQSTSVRKFDEKSPFVSVHIPICDEPVQQVRNTIISASSQDYDNYEVIVLYNNTSNKALVEPIKKLCQDLEKVRFYDKNKVLGYKAGALNQCLELMNSKTNLILTLDADYQLKGDALTTAVVEMQEKDCDLLQFPQAYVNHGSKNGLADELDHYFRYYARKASTQNQNLPTGTLTLLCRQCLEAIGGWPTESITEDAFLGTKLMENKCQLSFSDTIIGKGLMPSSPAELKTQRMRWIFGNFQTLVAVFNNDALSRQDKLIASAQLTSWINFLGLPLLTLLLTAIITLFTPSQEMAMITGLSITTLAIYLMVKLLTLYKSGFKGLRLMRTLLNHIATAVESAFVWWGYFMDPERPFSRTNKFATRSGLDKETWIAVAMVVGVITIHVASANFLWSASLIGCATVFILARISLLLSFRDSRNYSTSNPLPKSQKA